MTGVMKVVRFKDSKGMVRLRMGYDVQVFTNTFPTEHGPAVPMLIIDGYQWNGVSEVVFGDKDMQYR